MRGCSNSVQLGHKKAPMSRARSQPHPAAVIACARARGAGLRRRPDLKGCRYKRTARSVDIFPLWRPGLKGEEGGGLLSHHAVARGGEAGLLASGRKLRIMGAIKAPRRRFCGGVVSRVLRTHWRTHGAPGLLARARCIIQAVSAVRFLRGRHDVYASLCSCYEELVQRSTSTIESCDRAGPASPGR